jgi:hypothetical protein
MHTAAHQPSRNATSRAAATVRHLPTLPALGSQPKADASGSGWVFGTVRGLLRAAAAHRQAAERRTAGHAGSRHAAGSQPIESRLFRSPEGMGCPLSLEERIIADECADQPMSWEE